MHTRFVGYRDCSDKALQIPLARRGRNFSFSSRHVKAADQCSRRLWLFRQLAYTHANAEPLALVVCTENLIRVDDVTGSPKLAE
jgi:hypothetical protein